MRPALRAALGGLLPDATGTALLTACLANGAACRSAWEDFQRGGRPLVELFRTDRGELKRLGPLLLDNLGRQGAPVEPSLLTVLRMGYFREELRAAAYREVLGDALRALGGAGIEPLVFRGAALGESVYPNPALRHSHDIDLLLPAAERATAALALREIGCAAVAPGSADPAEPLVLSHPSGLPLRLHASLYQLSAHPSDAAELRARGRPLDLDGTPARIPTPEDALAQALGHAAYSPSRSTLQWACDAWMITSRHPGLDAGLFAAGVEQARLLLPCTVLLHYLAGLGAPQAGGLARTLEARTRRVSGLDRDLALYGLRRGARGGFASLLKSLPSRRTRCLLSWWTAFPTLGYLRWAHRPRHGSLLPAFYLIRLLRAAGMTRRSLHAGV